MKTSKQQLARIGYKPAVGFIQINKTVVHLEIPGIFINQLKSIIKIKNGEIVDAPTISGKKGKKHFWNNTPILDSAWIPRTRKFYLNDVYKLTFPIKPN